MADLRRTKLYDLHLAQGARMVPFAGWEMPVQYPMGVMGEHQHTRSRAGLFDVSHMGQVILRGPDVAQALETLVPADIVGLKPGRQRYGLFTAPNGGILDDLMIANKGDHLLLVVNAACAEQDIAHLRQLERLGISVEPVTDRALLALQGPEAEAVLARLVPGVAAMKFMDVAEFDWQGARLWISRSGYTGEDGFEISVPEAQATALAQALLDQPEVAPIGLGARDSLRLEAGMPLYGHDMNTDTLPGEAGLGWSIPKVRRQGGAREGGFPGAEAILAELAAGPARSRQGLRPEGRAPIREGVEIFDAAQGGNLLGRVCSGGFGPSVGGPVAMAILPAGLAEGSTLWAELRGKRLAVRVAPLPFHQPSYKR
ncbi:MULTISPECIES: glycine cleavage system aminomethyltransferase GcvT [unclassified Paracoccus (in: a-proteobacteria)]|uniref:glycine cleavage system aminomethyltransferase GcvT n=1 Tax=unclassified Paracoccus (in: a-proteobacteria) TaxID=2688777 RepID=UPI0012B3E72B|nr:MULTISPECIES: glycine cleavage system aminomethyltransferase GcvT [unclassified Paracoccus (in: a-proteobacteria)]UXU75500.1 glycine cleavage system aminomethyltransferase GcvT [Paracoccus sp. SMMA_5]UXU81405.1 glycine cleavage system aminomethyltransferase GcvT [Paracoccus sp. SMMA_5_TC]